MDGLDHFGLGSRLGTDFSAAWEYRFIDSFLSEAIFYKYQLRQNAWEIPMFVEFVWYIDLIFDDSCQHFLLDNILPSFTFSCFNLRRVIFFNLLAINFNLDLKLSCKIQHLGLCHCTLTNQCTGFLTIRFSCKK